MTRRTLVHNHSLVPRFVPIGVLLIAGLATGCDVLSPLIPDADEPPSENVLTDEERAFLVELGVGVGKHGFRFSITSTPMLTFSEERRVGRSRLVRFDGGVLATVQTSLLEPGTAVTLWQVVFNAPEHCSDGACGLDDFGNPDVRVDLLWVGGRVIGRSGRARFFVYRPEGHTAGSIAEPILGAPERGIEDAHAAEVHYVIRTHGPVIPGMERAMTHTFNGGCQLGSLPDDPRLGPVGPNTCADLQFGIHLP